MYEQCLNKLLPGRNMSFQLMIQRRGSRHVHRLTPSGAQAPALLTWMRKVPLVLEPNFFFIYQYLRIKITLSLSSIPPKCVLISDGAFILVLVRISPDMLRGAHNPHAPLPPPPPLSAQAVLSARPNVCRLLLWPAASDNRCLCNPPTLFGDKLITTLAPLKTLRRNWSDVS